MTITQSRFRTRVPLIAALAALVLCLCAPQALARYVYTGNYSDDNVSVIDTATNQVVGSPIPVGEGPYSMAITPNGKTLYVANENSEDLTVIDTQTNQPTGSVPLGVSPATIAISPDGTTAYVTAQGEDVVVVVDLGTNSVVGSPIPVGENPWGIGFTPDGKSAYVTNESDGTVSVIDTGTRQTVGSPITVGEGPINLTISPDGKFVYVANEDDGTISVIDTATNQVVGSPIPVGESPWSLALTPNGARLYVSNYADNDVSVIDTASRQALGSPIPTGEQPYELAATPDGKTVYVTNYESGGTGGSVTVIDTASNQASTTFPVTGGPWQLAIAPDQSPIASFATGTTKKDPLNFFFSGLGSTDPDGTIASYNWNFGDGTAAPNGGPTPSHKYAKAGTYPVSLTLVDNEGCSGMVFTGRTAHCNGPGPLTQLVTVKAPNNFKFGKLKRNVRKGTAKLTIKVPAAGKLVLSGKQVKPAKRNAKKAGKVTLNIRPKPKAKKQLAENGSAKVRVKVKFRPTGGTPKTKSKTLKLIQR